MTAQPTRLAIVDAERRIRIVDDTSDRVVSDVAMAGLWTGWGQPGAKPARHAWPSWSPDGKRLAFFRIDATDGARIRICEPEGMLDVEVLELKGSVPIYLQWSPDGQHIAVVSQRGDDLDLSVAATDGSDDGHRVTNGSPLFFAWTRPGRIAAFVSGGGPQARLVEIDPIGRGPTIELPGTPGSFCAPVPAGDRIVYVNHGPAGPVLVSVRPGQRGTTVLDEAEGLVAIVGSPSGKLIARANAPGGDGTPYRGISIINLETGEIKRISETECLAFDWTPDEQALVVARVDADRGIIEWHRIGLDGERTYLTDLAPSRDLLFFLRFFEQYVQSHSLVDPTSNELVIAGRIAALGAPDTPRIYRVPLTGGPPREVTAGTFAVWSPG